MIAVNIIIDFEKIDKLGLKISLYTQEILCICWIAE
tara:strand:- start:5026 stop:5133 length:108 start_codon:yes stop_codon:yes gene_type:complete